MSLPRLAVFVLPLALGLPLLTGGCATPAAVAAASYGADGVSVVESGKTTGDHFTSMVTKKDCAFWRVLRGQKICYERQGDRDPYQVNYNEPIRDQSEGGGIEYHAPLRAAPDAPVSSWDAAAYKAQPQPELPKPQPTAAVAEGVPPPPPEPAAATPAPAPKTKKPKGDHSAAKTKNKDKVKKVKPSPDQAAAVP